MSNFKPKALCKGDRIGIVAPASPCSDETIRKYCSMLIDCGYKIDLGKSLFSKRGYLAGDDICRAEDVNRMFANSGIDAVFCLRGGYGCTRMADKLDLSVIRKNPKIFLGFSDITVLHNIFNQKCGFITFHGPSVSNCEWGTEDFRYTQCMKVLRGGEFSLLGEECYNPCDCKGESCGGNLTLIESVIATSHEVDPTNKILLLEDVGEKNYSIDRRLNHLAQSGYFKACKAVVMGQFSDTDESANGNISLKEIAEDIIVPFGKPVLFGCKFGHIPENPTIPMGAEAIISGNRLIIPSSVQK